MNCKEFLARLTDYFDEVTAAELRAELEGHISKCGHCTIILNTTRQTIEIYRNNELYDLPQTLRDRLRAAVMEKCSKLKDKKMDCSQRASDKLPSE